MGQIENDRQLEISRNWVKRFRRVIEGYKNANIPPDIRHLCIDSTRFLIEKIEREIEEYLAHNGSETFEKNTETQAAS